MKLERLQFWTDIVLIALCILNVVFAAISGNWNAMLGWACAAIMYYGAMIAHKHCRHWFHKYCRAMGWEEDQNGGARCS